MKNRRASFDQLLADLGQPIACVDLETTGGRPQQDRILEVGIVFLSQNEEPREWTQLLNPGCSVSPYISKLTGIHAQMLHGMPRFEELAEQLAAQLQGHIIVAHNARFDLAFLRQSFLRAEIPFKAKTLCSVKLSRQLFPSEARHGLDAVMDRLAISCSSRHRALGDARVVAEFIHRMAEQRYDDLVHACKTQWQQESLPPNIDPQEIESIPNRPGVYLFLGKSELPLYIGKSIHLRKRVLDHFRNDFHQDREFRIAQQVEHIEWIETADELGALLLEARLVKERKPIYNRILRQKKDFCTIFWEGPGTEPPKIIHGAELRPGVCYGTFANRRSAKAALKHLAQKSRLCDIRLGLQNGTGSCFGFQIKRCLGACIGQESAIQHDERLYDALQVMQIQHWPYSGPIGIPEENDGFYIHVFDRWRQMGMIHKETGESTALDNPLIFDADMYRILLRYITNSPGNVLQLDLDW
ncbi:exonuclease domain-containing protein [Acidithiobacillus sp. IBUN Pt1247-S3]|uniref:exonuclease domain-containing protein n=1 Tax=Acidithiobacillus sp. IBUN Pt1247-S3 TaxID=3166642 RepID=UPI0034E5BCAF